MYVPALVVEELVKSIPTLLRIAVPWIRMKSASATGHYVLRWYFGYRLMTSIFVIVGDSLVGKTAELLDDPIGLIRSISDNVAANSSFFCTYIIVTGGVQISFASHKFIILLFLGISTGSRRMKPCRKGG